jgi:ATP-dependent DNA ligase
LKNRELPFQLDPLDKKFVFSKPKNSVEDKIIYDLEREGRAIYTRKRDGHCVYVVITAQGAKIYTRGTLRDITAHFPAVIWRLENLHIGENTLFAGELIAIHENTKQDWREHIASLVNLRDPHKALMLQIMQGYAKLMIYNVIISEGVNVTDLNHESRFAIIQGILGSGFSDVLPIEILKMTFDEAQAHVLKNAWEGLVIYDRLATTTYRLDGNADDPPRPVGCWKRKPSYEDDFVATSFVYGTKGKRHEKRMGKLNLAQYDPITKELVSCGEVGIGFSDMQREYFTHTDYPCVIQVEYERRFPPRQLTKNKIQCALCNPRFVLLRDDKNPAGCILPEDLAEKLKNIGNTE